MKKKWKWRDLIVLCTLGAIGLIFSEFENTGLSEAQNEALKEMLTPSTPIATKAIKATKATKAKREIASFSKLKKPKKKSAHSAKIIAHAKFKEQIRKKFKMGKHDSFQYKSIAPNQSVAFDNGFDRYRFLDFFYAIKDTPKNRKRYSNLNYEAKLGYIIVQSETPIVDSLPVVENEQTGHFGIFTGIIKAKLKDISDLDFMIAHNQYSVLQTYEHINLVQYKIDDATLAIKTYQKLQQNPKVIRASLEILEYTRGQR